MKFPCLSSHQNYCRPSFLQPQLKFQKGEEDKGEGDSAADDEVRAIEDNADGATAEDGDNNNEDTFDLGHQQQQQPQESSTPTPDARTGTAGSRKLQPASMQPTVMEVGSNDY